MSTRAPAREKWEEEVFAGHRWGRQGEKAAAEHGRLRKLWDAAQPVSDATRKTIEQIVWLEICNWKLEESVVALCRAIGTGRPAEMSIGHTASITRERWDQAWQYLAALRNWRARGRAGSYAALAAKFDPAGETQQRVDGMLGERDDLKELYVERFCLCLERWLQDWLGPNSLLLCGHRAAVAALEEEIRKRDPDTRILDAMRGDGDGRLQLCSHKAFRRYDIILSSIGSGKWRGAMPERGTDGLDRADLLASYIDPIDAWIRKGQQAESGPGCTIVPLLGKPDDTKRFLASLLVSLLRSQELTARTIAESRAGRGAGTSSRT